MGIAQQKLVKNVLANLKLANKYDFKNGTKVEFNSENVDFVDFAEKPADPTLTAGDSVDLGLPSGTLWAKENMIEDNNCVYEPYTVALRNNIPTKDQCSELFSSCQFKQFDGVIYGIGPNGNSITFPHTGYKRIGKEDTSDSNLISFFWIKNEDKESDHNAASLGNHYGVWKRTDSLFPGYKLPIRLVRKK